MNEEKSVEAQARELLAAECEASEAMALARGIRAGKEATAEHFFVPVSISLRAIEKALTRSTTPPAEDARQLPTVAELEAILADEGSKSIEMLPNGEIVARDSALSAECRERASYLAVMSLETALTTIERQCMETLRKSAEALDATPPADNAVEAVDDAGIRAIVNHIQGMNTREGDSRRKYTPAQVEIAIRLAVRAAISAYERRGVENVSPDLDARAREIERVLLQSVSYSDDALHVPALQFISNRAYRIAEAIAAALSPSGIERLVEAADPFLRLHRLNEPLMPGDDEPLSAYVPGAWPTWGDFRRLASALSSLKESGRQQEDE